MSDLPIVAYRYRGFGPFLTDGEYRQFPSYSYIPDPMQMDAHSHDCGAVAEPLADHAAATASLASAQQRIEALTIQVRQADERGDEAMRRAHAAEARAEELERALERVTWNFRLVLSSKPCRDVSETLAEADAALKNAAACASDRNPQGGDANAAPGRSPESAVRRTRPEDEPALSKAYLSGVSPQSAWPFAQDDKGTAG